ncbi:DNA internalization-related competence protein ComEC/Rec2 [Mycoplasmatota bacterium]|nr:DNA internalization-related competence protein ComEC/Rec2 [Mycoplasmatota bacterium]
MNQSTLEPLPIKAEIIEVNSEYLLIKSKSKYIVYTDQPEQYKAGMIVYVKGKLIETDEKNIEHTFSYNQYLRTQNIMGRIKANQIEIISTRFNLNTIPRVINKFFEQNYSEKVSTYLKLFILGYKDDLNESISRGSSDLGISHLFAISGMHLTIFVLILNKFLDLFYMKKRTHHLILGVFLLIYNIISGFPISIMRASIFMFLLLVFKHTKYKMNASDYLSFVFIGMLIYNPYYIFNLGFQLSYLISFVLILFKHLYIKQKGIKKIFYVSIIAVVCSLPMILSANKTIGVFNVLFNPIFIIYVSYILLPGAILVLICPLLSSLFETFILAFERLIIFFSEENLYLNLSFSHSLLVVLFWMMIVLSIMFFNKYRKKIVWLWMTYIFLIFSVNSLIIEEKVIIFDVNQADATYIQTKDCKILIDTGDKDDYDSLIHYFKGENIQHLDGIFLTHQHEDHYGEINDLISNLNVNKVYVSKLYDTFDLSIQSLVVEGDVIECGDNAIHVLHSHQESNNENNNSLVLYTLIKGESWLFTGDIEEEVEKYLIDKYHLEVNHLKVAHHGSKTSTSKAFLNHFKPDHSYISVGNNSYGIPDKDVINLLETYSKSLHVTKEVGSIVNVYGKLINYRYYYYQGKKHYHLT